MDNSNTIKYLLIGIVATYFAVVVANLETLTENTKQIPEVVPTHSLGISPGNHVIETGASNVFTMTSSTPVRFQADRRIIRDTIDVLIPTLNDSYE